jgi:hypothetical protein
MGQNLIEKAGIAGSRFRVASLRSCAGGAFIRLLHEMKFMTNCRVNSAG